MEYKRVERCRVCGGNNLLGYLNLGKLPLANGLASTNAPCKTYPLEVLFCKQCSLSQLSVVVDPKVLYSNYPYHSSVSSTFRKHCRDLAKKLKELVGPKPSMVDVASNDGAMLREFKAEGFKVFGVEPSTNLAYLANEEGLPTLRGFWSPGIASLLEPADVITATNVLAHVDNLKEFLLTVRGTLKPNGIFVVEVPYLANLINRTQFDTVYHEHLSYFLLTPLVRLFKSYGLPIFHVEEHDLHGGSLRLYASKDGRAVDKSVATLLRWEELHGFTEIGAYKKFADQVKRIKGDLMILLERYKNLGLKVVAFGASAKGSTLMNYCGVTKEHVKVVVDETPAKQGLLTPGNHIPIVPFDALYREKPAYVLLLVWNFEQEIRQKLRATGIFDETRGHIIVPVPTTQPAGQFGSVEVR